MALPTIAAADFIGDIKLSQNRFKTAELTNYINFYYPQIIADLIGQAALQEIEDTSPLPTKYTDLLQGSGTYYNIEGEQNRKKPQLVEIVKRVIYFQWVRDYSINTTSGDANNLVENAEKLTRFEIQSNARQRFNWSVKMFNDRVIPFIDNYTDFESSISSVVDLGGGNTQILTPNTIYLQNGDSVTIGGTEYVISNLVDNTSFDIVATFATAPTVYSYSPFEILIFEQQEPALF